MKKIITLIIALVMAVGLFACVDNPAPESVTLTYVSEGADVIKAISTDAASYGLIAEPAATNALKNANVLAKIENKRIDIQSEWKALTGLDGYPQASLLVKDGIDSAFVSAFLTAAEDAGEWAVNNPADAVSAIKTHALAETESTMPNITEGAVVERCGIYSKTDDLKSYIGTFLDKVNATKPKDDGIYYSAGGGTAKAEINVYMPDGATALALAYMMQNHGLIEGTTVNYNVVPPATIASYVKNGSADIVLIPTNAAINLYNSGATYKIASVMTHGNLFIIGTDTLSDLKGKTLAAIGEGNIPALVLNYILVQNEITVAE